MRSATTRCRPSIGKAEVWITESIHVEGVRSIPHGDAAFCSAAVQPSARIGPPDEPQPELSVSARQSRAAWARLIKKICEADPQSCPRCHKLMKVIAVITDPAQVLKILRPLIRKGTPTPRSRSRLAELIPSQCPPRG
jgi:hypothetical protein